MNGIFSESMLNMRYGYNSSQNQMDTWLFHQAYFGIGNGSLGLLHPFLLILGAFGRFRRRLKIIWYSKKPKGRSPIHENIVDLIIDMKRCNTIWGVQRISDELKILGISVSKKTVLKILRENGFIPPMTKFKPPSWRSVLDSFSRYWAMDFTTIFDANGIQIFIFAIIDIPSRRLILINSTANPKKNWLIQQFRNCSIGGHEFPRAMVHDRDGIYGKWLPNILQEPGLSIDANITAFSLGKPFHRTL
ncbi:MAG: hypothetical protein ACOH5I_24820 [Oligoflexus sp.]